MPASRSLICRVSVRTNPLLAVTDSLHGSYDFLAVYASAYFAEETILQTIPIFDNSVSVSAPTLTNADLDGFQLGGWLNWTSPATQTNLLDSYWIYLSDSDSVGVTDRRSVHLLSHGFHMILC